MQRGDHNQRKAIGDARHKGGGSQDADLLGAVELPVHLIDAGLVHDDLGIETLVGKEALLYPDKDWRMIVRLRSTDDDLRRLRMRAQGRQRNGHRANQ